MVSRLIFLGIGLESLALLLVLFVVIGALVSKICRRTTRAVPQGPRMMPCDRVAAPARQSGRDAGQIVLGVLIGAGMFVVIAAGLAFAQWSPTNMLHDGWHHVTFHHGGPATGGCQPPMVRGEWGFTGHPPSWLATIVTAALLLLLIRLVASQRFRKLGVAILGACALVLLVSGTLLLFSSHDRKGTVSSIDRLLDSPEMEYRWSRGDWRRPLVRHKVIVGHDVAVALAEQPPADQVDSSQGKRSDAADPPAEKLDDTAATGDLVKNRASREVERPDAPSAGPSSGKTGMAAEQPDAAAADTRPSGDIPTWVRTTPKLVGSVYRRTIVSDPFSTDRECQQQLDDEMMLITCQYIDDLLGLRPRSGLRDEAQDMTRAHRRLAHMKITPAYLRQTICKDEYHETVDTPVNELAGADMGRMRRIHLLMEFDGDVRADIKDRWREAELAGRLSTVGGGVALLIGCIAVVFGYLKLDTATKGYYTRRLQLAAGLATIVLMGALVRFFSSAGLR
ncbi:MAG: hypothetical protein ACC645_21735 [Pirellulales bacterium]